jgi:hypothetical protein
MSKIIYDNSTVASVALVFVFFSLMGTYFLASLLLQKIDYVSFKHCIQKSSTPMPTGSKTCLSR